MRKQIILAVLIFIPRPILAQTLLQSNQCSTAAAGSIACAYTNPVASSHLLWAAVMTSGVQSVTDNNGNSWNLFPAPLGTFPFSYGHSTAVWYVCSSNAGATTVTASGVGASYAGVIIGEVSGVGGPLGGPFSCVDAYATAGPFALGSSPASITTLASVTSGTEYFIAMLSDVTSLHTFTAGTGYTIQQDIELGGLGSLAVEDNNTRTGLSGTQTATMNYDSSVPGGGMFGFIPAPNSAAPLVQYAAFIEPQGGFSTFSFTTSTAQTAGNLNVVLVSYCQVGACSGGVDPATVTDSNHNSYTCPINTFGGTNRTEQICYAYNIAGGPNTVTVTATIPFDMFYPVAILGEFSGVISASDPLDVASTTGNIVGPNFVVGPVTTTAPRDLLVGATACMGNYKIISPAFKLCPAMAGYGIASSAGSYTMSWPFDSGCGGQGIAAFFTTGGRLRHQAQVY